MVGVGSASVVAGDFMYLLYNQNKKAQIDFWKIPINTRKPEPYVIAVQGGETELSDGGAIAAVYIAETDEIHVYFAGKPKHGTQRLLREVCLKNAKAAGKPGDWIDSPEVMVLNRKSWTVDPKSPITATVRGKLPSVFYSQDDDLEEVTLSEYELKGKDEHGNDKFDWETTPLTGFGV